MTNNIFEFTDATKTWIRKGDLVIPVDEQNTDYVKLSGTRNFDLSAIPVADIVATSLRISKLTLVDRLVSANLFDAAMTAIKSNDLTYERWQASISVDTSNADVRALLLSIGGDLELLLAAE